MLHCLQAILFYSEAGIYMQAALKQLILVKHDIIEVGGCNL